MENLNAEQVKKALECCIDRGYEVLLEGTIDQIVKEMLESGDG